ncbi:MAG TPA: hypothetical protein VK509_12930 [Polyangiales bacterium]|nr:hypothetical protein [Polyangiales bacterium]
MRTLSLCALVMAVLSCGDDDDAAEADLLGVGAQCTSSSECLREGDGGINLACLDQFKGGYCGLEDCSGNEDCPERSVCVAHDDGRNYCFRSCTNKLECNANRDPDNEANCSANIEFVDADTAGKACVPPSG